MSQGWRSVPLPPDWLNLRQVILHRDAHTCYLCAHHANEVDHIIPAFRGGTDHPSNLAAICTPCHRSKTGREARGPSRRRPPPPHPGAT